MKFRKLSAIVLAALMCIGLVTGCAGTDTETSDNSASESEWFTPALDTETEQTITVLGNYDNFEALDAAAASFQEFYPNITIQYEKMDDYNENIGPRVASDTEAAIFMVNRYNFINNEYLPDAVADISTLDIDFDAISDDAIGWYIDDKMFGIPLWFRYYGLVVNKDILEKEGLSVPTNMTELEECCDALMEAGYEPPLQQAPDLAMTFLYNNIAEVVAKEMTADEAAALIKGEEGSAEALARVYEKLFGMMDKGYLSIDNMKEYEDNYNFAILKFYEGNTPFLVASTQTVSGMAKRESNSEAFQENPFEYEFIFAPTGEDGPIVFKGDDTGFALNKNCSYYDAAAEFYRFIYTEKILNQFSEIKGTPSTAANPDNELYTSLPDVSEDNLILFTDIDDPTDRTKDVFVDVAAAIVEGAVTTPEEATAKFEELAAAQEAESN